MRTVSRILFLLFFGLACYAAIRHEFILSIGSLSAASLVPVVIGTIIMLNANLCAAQRREDILFSSWPEERPDKLRGKTDN